MNQEQLQRIQAQISEADYQCYLFLLHTIKPIAEALQAHATARPYTDVDSVMCLLIEFRDQRILEQLQAKLNDREQWHNELLTRVRENSNRPNPEDTKG